MAIPALIKEFLESHQVPYQFCIHSPAYTAQGLAHVQHVSGKELAKVVMVVADDRMIMTVLPGSHRVNLDRLGQILSARSIRLATEEEFRDLFPDCELGAMPPFGNLYDLRVYIDASFGREKEFFFQAGNHHEVARMAYAEYARLVNPVVGELTLPEGEKRPGA